MGKDAIKLPFRLTREQMELRRLAAAKDLQAGMKQAEVAHKYGVSRASVCRWDRTLRAKGLKGLKLRKAKGKERKLPLEKLKKLPKLLAKGAVYYGYTTDLWTSKRVARLIQEEFGVEYSPKRVWSLLRELGLSWQRPKRRAKERDELARYIWLMKTWPEIKKKE